MQLAITPIFVAIIFGFCILITRRAKSNESITATEALSVYMLILTFFVWTLIAVGMGIRGTHLALMPRIPLLWQALVPVVLLFAAFTFYGSLRSGLRGIAGSTLWHWLVFFQAFRIGALGGVIKGLRGEITSGYVFWIGIPDFLFGISALVVGWLLIRQAVGPRFLIVWNLVGVLLILLPTFIPMSYWMHEPGFFFIFEFPMVLAPSIIVPTFISLNLLHAWGVYIEQKRYRRQADVRAEAA